MQLPLKTKLSLELRFVLVRESKKLSGEEMVGEFQNKPKPTLFIFVDKLIKARAWLLSGSPLNTQLLWEELFIEWAQIFQVNK